MGWGPFGKRASTAVTPGHQAMHETDEIERLVGALRVRGRSASLGVEPARPDDRSRPARTSGGSAKSDSARPRTGGDIGRSGSIRRHDAVASSRSPRVHSPVDPRYGERRRYTDATIAPPPAERVRSRDADRHRYSSAETMARTRSLGASSEPRTTSSRPALSSSASSLTRANTIANSATERVSLPRLDRHPSFGSGHIAVTGLRNAGN